MTATRMDDMRGSSMNDQGAPRNASAGRMTLA
jgi:hypothetical protein